MSLKLPYFQKKDKEVVIPQLRWVRATSVTLNREANPAFGGTPLSTESTYN